jgi:hypothetical protein
MLPLSILFIADLGLSFSFLFTFFLFFRSSKMAFNQSTSLPPNPKHNKRNEYYPLWRHVKKIAKILGGGSWEWQCNLLSSTI